MKRLFTIVVLLLAATLTAAAQDTQPIINPSEESLVITWPPPVTEVWSAGDVLGTANVTNMAYFYIEYKQLNIDLTEPANAPWLPATVGITEPVVNGPLATLDTASVPDGLYALRLTANTQDGQSFHYTVSPIRVNNARFLAVEQRIRAQAMSQSAGVSPTPVPPTAAPPDNTPHISPSGIAVNVRRCDLVDNDRCPIIDSIPPGEFAAVTARNSANTWYQVRTDSSVQGWVSRTVIVEAGDFSGVPVATPPSPLPPRPQPPTPAPVTSVFPNGMAVEGGSATCNQPFNVQINVANTGSSVSAPGTVTLQDVNVRTGTVTFSGYGNYPAINPGGNYVVVIQVNTNIYFNEQHELRAFTNGQQYTIRYNLAQGSCGVAQPPMQPSRTQRTFATGECNVAVNQEGEVYGRPDGEFLSTLPAGVYPALQVQQVGNTNWYQLGLENSMPWVPTVPYIAFQGNCGL